MRSFVFAAAAAAFSLSAGQAAQAAEYVINLFGDPSTGFAFSQDAFGLHYDRVQYDLSGLELIDPITVMEGDVIHATVQFQDGAMTPAALTVAGSELQSQFLLYLFGDFTAAATSTAGLMSFYNGADLVTTLTSEGTTSSQLANRSTLNPPFNGPITFDRFTADFTITALTSPATLSDAAFGTALISTSAAVPEPATWAMMILGFGATGAMVRSRRRLFAGV